jgi:Helix-turn-helix domain
MLADVSSSNLIEHELSVTERRLLTPVEVAALLRVTPRTVRRYGSEGRLQRIKIGNRLSRYTAESVAALISPETSEAPVTSGDLAKLADPGGGHDAKS